MLLCCASPDSKPHRWSGWSPGSDRLLTHSKPPSAAPAIKCSASPTRGLGFCSGLFRRKSRSPLQSVKSLNCFETIAWTASVLSRLRVASMSSSSRRFVLRVCSLCFTSFHFFLKFALYFATNFELLFRNSSVC